MPRTRAAIALLLRCYPKAWRDEYGLELAQILAARPLTLTTIVNVLVSALLQRVRSVDLATKLGIAAMLVIIAETTWNFGALLARTRMTLPTVVVTPLMSNTHVLYLIACGCWIHLRQRATASRSGIAAMKITFIAGLPVMVLALLMLAGVAPVALNPWAGPTAPLLRLPACWIWGAVGGQLGRLSLRAGTKNVAPLTAIAMIAGSTLSSEVGAQAQNSGARFEVASVKPNKSGDPGGSLRIQPGGRVVATNMPLRNIVSFAYQANPFTLVGGPDWITQERFDITAKLEGDNPPPAPSGTASDPFAIAMRGLLADRFALKVHRETRDVDAYALVLARTGGNTGPAMKRSTDDCSPEAIRARATQTQRAPPPPAPGSRNLPPCGVRLSPGLLQFSGLPLSNVLGVLGGVVGRVVVDRTGLDGAWEFELKFSPDNGRGLPPRDNAPPADPDLPSIFAALQEQLGLKLEPAKTPLDVVVIDAMERPTPD